MKLATDFRDYYDWAFDGRGAEFDRRSAGVGPGKREQFRILAEAGYETPPVGTLRDLYDSVSHARGWAEGRAKFVVAYTDESAHVGEGKELWDIGRWRTSPDVSGRERHADKWDTFCSVFVEGTPGVSWRLLQVGPHQFWIEYASETDWRSNCGEGDVELLEANLNAGCHPHIDLPLFAIDFVHGRKDMYAVDFNVAPGVKGSGVEKVLPAADAVAAIEGWFAARGG